MKALLISIAIAIISAGAEVLLYFIHGTRVGLFSYVGVTWDEWTVAFLPLIIAFYYLGDHYKIRYEVFYKGELWAKFNNWTQAEYLGNQIIEISKKEDAESGENDNYQLLHIHKFTIWNDISNFFKKIMLPKFSPKRVPYYEIIVWSEKQKDYTYMP